MKDSREVVLRVPPSCRPKAAHEKDELTESIEEYTEGIYRLQEEMEIVGTGDIAKYMCVKPPTATVMLKKLQELGLAEHTPYQGVTLTQKGKDLSISLLRKHRLVERMLVDFLELPWDDVHDLACKLEHYIGEDVADRIAKAMNYPTTCPHGNPIDATFNDGSRRLETCAVGEELRVVKITDERIEFLTYVLDIGLVPGVRTKLKARTPFGDVITLAVEQEDGTTADVAIGRDVATSVWVCNEGWDESKQPRI
jgi:DtxR family transcriptional regulator, Mn-dependent transcriptional regulator